MIRIIIFILLAFFGYIQKAFSQDTVKLTKQQMIQDIDLLVDRVHYAHINSYHYRSREEWQDYIEKMKQGLPDTLALFDFWRKTEEIFVFMNDAHTRTYPSAYYRDYIKAGGMFFPLNIKKAGSNYTVTKVYGNDTLINNLTHIQSINDKPIDSVFAMMKLHSGKELDALDDRYISDSFIFYFWKTFNWQPPYTVGFINASGNLQYAELDGVTYQDLKEKKERSKAGKQVCELTFIKDTIALIKIRDFYSMSRKGYKKFYRKTFRKINKREVKNIILDFRNHDGGDSRYGEDLAKYFADKPFRASAATHWKVTPEFRTNFAQMYIPGIMRWAKFLYGINKHTKAIYSAKDNEVAVVNHKLIKPKATALRHPKNIYLLTDNYTFSAGSMFAAMVKDYKLGIIVGEPTGNLSSFYADPILWYKLPNSGIAFQVSTSFNLRPNGQNDDHSIEPDVYVETNEDALEKALQIIMK